ncbi:MAG: tetratricopeptide repeat protein [Planctomycetota bacterium]|jgi:tetratricopeptide (TPR) repeat protein
MARTILTTALIVLLYVLVGCQPMDSGRGMLMMAPPPAVLKVSPAVAGAGEIDLVEQMAQNRSAYHQSLVVLVDYYTKTGNDMKLGWASKELGALDSMPRYKYVVEAEVAGPSLKAEDSIAEADYIFRDGMELENKAGAILKNDNMLRMALDLYNQVITRHPSSDKIDDAAYRAGVIYEHFKDYRIALLYYQRTSQWDPQTVYPARFREAWILDQKFHEHDKALAAYERALKTVRDEMEHHNWRKFAEKRIRELTKTEEEGK